MQTNESRALYLFQSAGFDQMDANRTCNAANITENPKNLKITGIGR